MYYIVLGAFVEYKSFHDKFMIEIYLNYLALQQLIDKIDDKNRCQHLKWNTIDFFTNQKYPASKNPIPIRIID